MLKTFGSYLNLLAAVALAATIAVARGPVDDKFPTGKFVTGPFTVSFEQDGKVSVTRDGEIVVEGAYTVTKDEITFNDKSGPMACTDAGPGRFKWKFDGKALTFKVIEDGCGGRANALTSQPLTKKEN